MDTSGSARWNSSTEAAYSKISHRESCSLNKVLAFGSVEVNFDRGVTTRVKDLIVKLKEKRKRKAGRGYLASVDFCD